MPPGDYRGKPSRACETCRARRVKCDETKPTCQRCSKANRPCKYRDLFEISIRNETEVAARKAQNAWRQRAKPRSDRNTSVLFTPLAEEEVFEIILRPPPAPNRHDVVCSRFLFDFTLPTDILDPFKGIMDFLPHLYLRSNPSSALHSAVAAISHMNFFRRSNHLLPEYKIAASKHYANALVRVQQELQSEASARSDALLIAVDLMGGYETMVAGTSKKFMETHAQGLAALLRLRFPPNPADGLGFRTWNTAHLKLLSYCLQLGRRSFVPYEVLRWHYETSDLPLVRLVGLMHQTIDTLAEWNEHLNSGIGGVADYTYLHRLYSLDSELLQWSLARTTGWEFEATEDVFVGQPKFLRDLALLPGAPTRFHMYRNLPMIHVWNLNRVLRLAIHRSILRRRGPRIGGSDLLPPVDQSLVTIREIFDEVCSSVYSHFIVSVPGRNDVNDTQDIIGLRQFLLLIPINVALTSTKELPINPIPKERWDWADKVWSFLLSINHADRTRKD